MAVFSNSTNQVYALRELYTDDGWPKDLVYRDNPLLALMPKDESLDGMVGKYIPVPTIYGNPMGRSATFSDAQNNQSPSQGISFFVFRTSNYALATIQNEQLMASASNKGAFISDAKKEIDGAFQTITNDLALDLYGDGTGRRGTLASISTGVITLGNAADVVNFEINMALVSYSVSGTTATISTGGAIGYVIAVDRSAGTVTVSTTVGGSAGTPTNWSASFPNLAVEGDVNFASGGLASGSSFKITGLAGWIPATAPTSGDSFWSVDRSVDPTRLGGQRYDGSSQSIEEALIDAASQFAREGARPSYCFINFTSYAALEKSLGAKVQYVSVYHEEACIGFDAIRIHGPYGQLVVIPDRSCPSQTAYLLDLNTFKLRSMGKVPHILTYGAEGLEALRVGNADALEFRIGYYANLICDAPGRNGRVTLSE